MMKYHINKDNPLEQLFGGTVISLGSLNFLIDIYKKKKLNR